MDARLEKILEAWYDYDHALDEFQKEYHREQRARYIQEAVKALDTYVSVQDFLHARRDQYRDWAIKRNLKSPKKRF